MSLLRQVKNVDAVEFGPGSEAADEAASRLGASHGLAYSFDMSRLGHVEIDGEEFFGTFLFATRREYENSSVEPVVLGNNLRRGRERYWLVDRRVYATDDLDLTSQDVRALANEQVNRRRLALEKAHALQAMTANLDNRVRRDRIPQSVKVSVWQRDSGRCVECDSQRELEFDHIIPLAMGGSNSERNLQLLCAVCNRRKGATLG